LNLFILLSYPLNFFIYCAMSRQFRDAFRELCCLCCGVATAPAANASNEATMYVTIALNDVGAARATTRVSTAKSEKDAPNSEPTNDAGGLVATPSRFNLLSAVEPHLLPLGEARQ